MKMLTPPSPVYLLGGNTAHKNANFHLPESDCSSYLVTEMLFLLS